jgi:hypothetical protein
VKRATAVYFQAVARCRGLRFSFCDLILGLAAPRLYAVTCFAGSGRLAGVLQFSLLNAARVDHLAKHVRFGRIALEMGVAFAGVIVQLVHAGKTAVFNH